MMVFRDAYISKIDAEPQMDAIIKLQTNEVKMLGGTRLRHDVLHKLVEIVIKEVTS